MLEIERQRNGSSSSNATPIGRGEGSPKHWYRWFDDGRRNDLQFWTIEQHNMPPVGDGWIPLFSAPVTAQEPVAWRTMSTSEGVYILTKMAECAQGWRDRGLNVEPLFASPHPVSADHDRLVRELDVALNGVGAAEQASLCDIVAQVRSEHFRLVRVSAERKEAEDTARLDWLELQVIEVRRPLHWGSDFLFSEAPQDPDGEPLQPSDLRAQIDALRNGEQS